MRRQVLALSLCLAGTIGLPAQGPTPDPVTRLLADLETALGSGSSTRLTALETPSLAPETVNGIARAVVGGPGAQVTVRERARRTTAQGTEVLADVFLAEGDRARVVTWRLKLARPTTDSRLLIAGVDEQGTLDDLLKLTLDGTHQFAIHNLAFRAIDLTLTVPSGTAFLAQADDGVTALVLRGRGRVRFAPPDRAEQGELQIFAHQSELSVDTSDEFIRINPSEFADRLADGMLSPMPVDPSALAAARQVFEDFAPQTFGIDLREVGQRGWSFEPHPGHVVVEFKAGGLGWLTYARSPNEFEDVTLFKRASGKLISSYASAERLATRGKFYSDNANATYRVEHYDLDVAFDPMARTLRGHASLRLRVLADAISSLTIRLHDDLAVSSVTAPGAERLLAVRLTGQNRLLINLPGPVPHDAVVALEVAYAGRLVPGPFDREALEPGAQDQTQTDQPHIDDFRPDPERVWIYSGRLPWYPQADSLDHATATLTFRVPADFDVVASGTLVRSTVSAAGPAGPALRTSQFVADRPVRYLACAISRFSPVASLPAAVVGLAPSLSDPARKATTGPASIDVNVVATPRAVNPARALGPRAVDMVRFYAGLVGEAPYPGLTVAALEENIPGGHSPGYLTLIRQRLPTSVYLWRTDPVAFDRLPNFLLAHEVAHQWWGQAVGWKNYHEQWLSEGLAQYFAVLYTGSVLGPAAMHDLLSDMRSSVLGLAHPGPIALGYRLGHLSNDPTMFRVIVYNKSAVVLDMLRRLIGDQAFYRGLARFYQAHRFSAAGTDDLARALEQETPLRLDHFFDTWILGATVPEAKVTAAVDAGGRTATVRVEPVGPPADFPMTIEVQYQDGTAESVTVPVIDGAVVRQIPLKGPVRHLVTKDDITLVRFRN
jgi:hypothetical protein